MTLPGPVVVWGNCQSPALQALLRAPLARHGLEVVPVPTVYEATAAEVEHVHRVVAGASVLVSQPVAEEYRFPGCGTEFLAGLLPPHGRLLRIPSVVHTAWFPYQVNGHTGAGVRIPAPLVDYHDLRLVAAAARGDVPDPDWNPPDGTVAAHAERSLAELRRRERGLDVTISDALAGREAMFAMNHPSNHTLGVFAQRILDALGLPGRVDLPHREFLGELRTGIDAAVAAGLGADPVASPWRRAGAVVTDRDIAAAHLVFYREHPDVVADCLGRYRPRLDELALL